MFLNENPRRDDFIRFIVIIILYYIILLLDVAFDAQMIARTTQEAGMSPASIALPGLFSVFPSYLSPSFPLQHTEHTTHHTPHGTERPPIMTSCSSSSSSSRCSSSSSGSSRRRPGPHHQQGRPGGVRGRILVLLFLSCLGLAHVVVDAFILPSLPPSSSLPASASPTFVSITSQQQQRYTYSSSSSSLGKEGGWTR